MMREGTKQRYKDAILDMIIYARQNGGKLHRYDMEACCMIRKTDNTIAAALQRSGYIAKIDDKHYHFVVDYKDIDVVKLNKDIRKRRKEREQERNASRQIDDLKEVKQIIYKLLPDEFETQQVVAIAAKHRISERTAKRFLNNKVLFRAVKHGTYRKLIIEEQHPPQQEFRFSHVMTGDQLQEAARAYIDKKSYEITIDARLDKDTLKRLVSDIIDKWDIVETQKI